MITNNFFTARKRSLGQSNVCVVMCVSHSVHRGWGSPSGQRLPQYLYLVAATEAGGTHPTGMHACFYLYTSDCGTIFLDCLSTRHLRPHFNVKVCLYVTSFNQCMLLPSARQGNVFTRVCHSVHRGGEAGVVSGRQTSPWQADTTPPPQGRPDGTHPTVMHYCYHCY